MATQIQDLRPSHIFCDFLGKNFKLKNFTLDCEVWAINKYGSTKVMVEKLNKPEGDDALVIFEVIWKLLSYKGDFNGYNHFLRVNMEDAGSKGAFIKNTNNMYTALAKVFENSSPLVKNKNKMALLKKIKAAQGLDTEPCFAKYYDTLGSRYGYDLDQFYSLTMRQLHILLQAANDGRFEELEIEANLAGRKLKPRAEVDMDTTPEQDEAQDKEAEGAYQRLLKKYKDSNGK